MFIFQKVRQHRRDFRARYKCQFCGSEVEDYGYDDRYFHESVIPWMVCKRCGRSSEGVATSSPTVPDGVLL